jgi:hypothetical protein
MATWKQAAAFVTIVFVITVVQAGLAGPLVTLQDALVPYAGGSGQFDGVSLIEGLFSSWFDMGLVAIFLLAGAVIARLVRRELTRQGRRP